MLTVVLGLGSSLCWGFADFLGGLKSRGLPVVVVLLVSQLTALALAATAAVVISPDAPDGEAVLIAAAAGGGSMLALGAFYRALAIGTMSIVAPVASTGAIIPVVVGLAGGDRPSALALAGIVLAMTGVFLASREQHDDAEAAADGRRSIMLALFAAVGFGLFFVSIDAASEDGEMWAILFSRVAGVSAILLFVAVTRPSLDVPRAELPVLVVMGFFDLGAVTFYSLGTQEGLLSVLAVLSSLYPVVPVVLGQLVLHERIRRVQAIGVGAALMGVILIAAG